MNDAAPSAPPTSVRVSVVNSTTISVQWGPVHCIHQNGEITWFSLRYGEAGNRDTETLFVSGGSVTQSTISSLLPSTNYSVQVAGVNSDGTGVYSTHVHFLMPEMSEWLF